MWVARDKNGRLNLFEGCPSKNEKTGIWEYYTIFSDCSRPSWEHWFSSKIIDRTLFPDLKWEDEPMQVLILPMPTPVMVTNWMSEIPPHCRVCSHCHCMQPKGQEACEYYNERVEYMNKLK